MLYYLDYFSHFSYSGSVCNGYVTIESFQGTLTALASFSKGQLVSMLRSAALLSPIAYLGQMTSPLATNAADNFLAEVCALLRTIALRFHFLVKHVQAVKYIFD